MANTLRTRGIGPKEGLLALGVILVFAAVMIPLASRQGNKSLLLTESSRMRRVYVALSLYEQQVDQAPAPTLVAATPYDNNLGDYQSTRDPFLPDESANENGQDKQHPHPYPNDPGILNQEHSTFRNSFSYIQNFIRNRKITVKPWGETRLDPMIGELADEWLGNVSPRANFAAEVSGRVLRIGTDGAVFVLSDRGGPKPLGDADDLFLRRK